jgi:hypothetical protein
MSLLVTGLLIQAVTGILGPVGRRVKRRGFAAQAGDGAGQPLNRVFERHRLAAASGWSPNSCAIRPAQPRTPNCRTVQLIASATMSAVEESDGCSADAKSASHLMIVFIAWVLSSAAAAAMR